MSAPTTPPGPREPGAREHGPPGPGARELGAREDAPEPDSPPAPPPVKVTPVRRLLSLAVAGFAGLLAVGLIFGAQTAGVGPARIPYAIVIFGIQVLFVLAFTMALRPPGVPVVVAVALFSASTADGAAVIMLNGDRILQYQVFGVVAASIVGMAFQLARRAGRIRATEAITATLVVVSGATSYALLIALTRVPLGTQVITVCLASAGLSLVVARLVDTVLPWPRLSPHVPRGATGVVLGPMAGTVTAAFLGSYLVGFDPTSAALVGLVTGVAAVLADLSVGYAEAGRPLVGEPPTMWIARHLQGPLAGFAVAAPLAYVLSVGLFAGRYV